MLLGRVMVMSDIEREEFERAVTDRWSDSYSFTRFGDEDYYDEVLEGMWWGWQASRQALSSCSEIPNSSGHASRQGDVALACAYCGGAEKQAVSVPQQWRDTMEELAADLESEIENRRSGDLDQRIERDLIVVREARALLAEQEQGQ